MTCLNFWSQLGLFVIMLVIPFLVRNEVLSRKSHQVDLKGSLGVVTLHVTLPEDVKSEVNHTLHHIVKIRDVKSPIASSCRPKTSGPPPALGRMSIATNLLCKDGRPTYGKPNCHLLTTFDYPELTL